MFVLLLVRNPKTKGFWKDVSSEMCIIEAKSCGQLLKLVQVGTPRKTPAGTAVR